MALWYSAVYTALLAACAISFIISFFTKGSVSFGSILAGYCLLILSVMMILIILFNSILKITVNSSMLQTLLLILSTTGPFLLMLGTIGFLMYLVIFYMTPIIEGHISQIYHSFSNIAIILLLIQMYIVYQNISNDKFVQTGKLSKITSSVLYLFGTLTLFCSLILFTILKYFRTDG
jgi:uncharacterized YccA/Bax inhibitor family protein